MGGDGQLNATNYLAGGVPFGPVIVSRNITPDATGLPAGLTYQQFKHVMRTGEDPDHPGRLLQVMPWPAFRHMTDFDIRAIYEYLRAIPHAEGGNALALTSKGKKSAEEAGRALKNKWVFDDFPDFVLAE
jgi:hypothetical protein